MKFSCLQQDITSALFTMQKAAVKNNSSASQYLYIEANQCIIKLVYTGIERTVIIELNGNVTEEGKILAPLSLLNEILSKMPNVSVNFDIDNNFSMTVHYMQMKYKIQCFHAASFSFTENISSDVKFTISSNILRECIRQTYFIASQQDNRPVLTGILLKCNNGAIDFVSTDGTRIALRKAIINEDISFEIIIPSTFIYDIIHSSDNRFFDDQSVITFNDKYIKIKFGNTTLITGLISGKFINYNSIIPQNAGTVMTCERNSFLSILERASILSDESLYTVKLEIKYSKLYVSSSNSVGNGYEEIPVQTEGNPILTAFNSKSFIEILKNIECDLITFEFTTGTRVCKIAPVESDELLYLISPIRI